MFSLSLLSWLVILCLLWLGGLTAGAYLYGRQLLSDKQRLEAQLLELQQAQSALMQSTVGMGRRLQKLIKANESGGLLAKTDEATLNHAMRLIELGASTKELVENCGLPRAEAELLLSLKRRPVEPPEEPSTGTDVTDSN